MTHNEVGGGGSKIAKMVYSVSHIGSLGIKSSPDVPISIVRLQIFRINIKYKTFLGNFSSLMGFFGF